LLFSVPACSVQESFRLSSSRRCEVSERKREKKATRLFRLHEEEGQGRPIRLRSSRFDSLVDLTQSHDHSAYSPLPRTAAEQTDARLPPSSSSSSPRSLSFPSSRLSALAQHSSNTLSTLTSTLTPLINLNMAENAPSKAATEPILYSFPETGVRPFPLHRSLLDCVQAD
jgi:hypothetical protein